MLKKGVKIDLDPIKVASVTNNTILTFFDTHNLRSKNFVLESKCKIFMPIVSSDKMAGTSSPHIDFLSTFCWWEWSPPSQRVFKIAFLWTKNVQTIVLTVF